MLSRIARKTKITSGLSKDPNLASPCHVFTGGLSKGYGIVSLYNLSFRVHTFVCEHKMKKRTPEGQVVRHLCGIKACCNPDHLTFGTPGDNRIDGILHGDIKYKFNPDVIRQIRRIPIANENAIKKAAQDHDVKPDYIRNIIRRQLWDYVE